MADAVDNDSAEIWEPVPEWEGYFVSSQGRVRGPRRLLSQHTNNLGYCRVPLTHRPSGRKKTVAVHKIVCEAFYGKRPNGLQINHIDNCRSNNFISNLEYVTAKQNCQHRRVHGTFPVGENNGRARLTKENVAEIRRRRGEGELLAQLAREFSVHKNTIWFVVTGGTWK